MSSHFQVHCLAAQNMEVQMGNSLTGVGAAVGDHAVTVHKAFCLGDLSRYDHIGVQHCGS